MAAKYPDDAFPNRDCCCSMCFDRYKDPRALSCIHTFCQECIHQYLMKKQTEIVQNKGINCPICRKVTRVNLKDITTIKLLSKSLPVNFALEEALIAVDMTKENASCVECSKKLSANIKFLCIECAGKIRTKHETPAHDSSWSLSSDYKDDVSNCTLHNKKLKFYCDTDDVICCSKCMFKYHRKCEKVTELSEVEEQQRIECAETLQNQICSLKRKVKNVRQFLAEKSYEMKRTSEKISNVLSDVKSTEIKQAQECLRHLTELKCRDLSKYQLQFRKCLRLIDGLVRVEWLLILASQKESTQQTFIALHEIKGKCFEYSEQLKEYFSDLTFSEVSLEIKDGRKKKTDSQYNLKIKRMKSNINALSDYRIIKLYIIDTTLLKRTGNEKEQPLFSGMAFLSDGRLAVCDNRNWKCVVFNTKLQKLGEIKLSNFIYGITTTKDDHIFITGVRTLESLRFGQDNCFTKPNSTNISSRGDSLTVCDNNNFVIGTFKSPVPARTVSKDGNETDLDIEFPDKEWEIGMSKCTYDIKNKRLVVTDRHCDTVYIYNLKKRGKIEVNSHCLKKPSGVAFGPANCIFVCSEDTNCLVQIAITGEILHPQKLDMISPCTLAFSEDRKKLAVANNNNEKRKLQIFDVVFYPEDH